MRIDHRNVLYHNKEIHYKKQDGMGDDPSRTENGGRPKHFSEPYKDLSMLNWVPGEHRTLDRFRRLIYGNRSKPPKTWQQRVSCKICDGPMKVQQKEKKCQLVLACDPFISLSFIECFQHQYTDDPKMQSHFENWMMKLSDVPSIQSKKNQLKQTPHHYHHHKFLKNETPHHFCRNGMNICLDCPDPFRPWIRKEHPNHFYKGMYISPPILLKNPNEQLQEDARCGFVSNQHRLIEKRRLTSYSLTNMVLKQALQDILKNARTKE